MSMKLLEELIYNYTQLCQRDNGSIYGIASGKQCRKGKPIAIHPNDLKLGGRAGLKQVRVGAKDKLRNLVAKARAIGLDNNDIRKVKDEVRKELQAKKVQGKEALKLFAKKANQLAKEKKASSSKNSKPKKPGKAKPGKPKKSEAIIPSGKDYKEYVRAGEENNKEVLSRLKKLKEDYDKAEKTKKDFFAKINNVSLAEARQALAERTRIAEEGAKLLQDLKLKYLNRGDKNRAKDKANDVMDASITSILPRSESFYRENLYNLNRITNNSVSTLSSLIYTDPRASTFPVNPFTGQSPINVGQRVKMENSMGDLWHEFGHHVEFSNSDLLPAMKSWLRTRASGKLEKLSVITGDSRYGDDEVAWVGNFGLGPYVGKDYAGATEVISMGLEEFSTPTRMFNFYLADPEHFALTLGVLDSL